MVNSDAISDVQSYGIDTKNRELYLHGYVANTDDDPGIDYKMASTFYKKHKIARQGLTRTHNYPHAQRRG